MRAVSRRRLLLAFPALAAASRILDAHGPGGTRTARPHSVADVAQPPTATAIRVRTLHGVGLAVAEPKRTIEFYQGLFRADQQDLLHFALELVGMPIEEGSGIAILLRVGAGPPFLQELAAADGEES